MIEKVKHRKAFEYYYGLGVERSFQLVGEEFKTTRQLVDRWSKTFGWREKVQLRDANNLKKLEIKTDIKVVDDKAKMLSLVRGCLNLFAENLKNRNVEISNIGDLDKLIKNALLLQSQPTDLSKIDLTAWNPEDLQKNIDKLIEQMDAE